MERLKTVPVNLVKVSERNYAIDVRGYTCPFPEIYMARALAQMSAGQLLEVTSDNPASCDGISSTAKKSQSDVRETTKINISTWKIIIQKNE